MTRRDEQFDAMLDAELRALDAELAAAMAAPRATQEMVERIDAACGLAQAMRVQPVAGLEDRIYAATVAGLPSRSVLARIGPVTRWAVAAGLILAAVVMFRFGAPRDPSFDLATLDRHMDQVAADADLAGVAVAEMDAPTMALAVEIDELAMAIEDDAMVDLFGDGVEDLADELMVLEAETNVF